MKVGILHPGKMGVSIAASAQNNGCKVYWISHGRSTQTIRRAREHHFVDLVNLPELCQTCERRYPNQHVDGHSSDRS